jgi:ABC-type sugar transport system ATPase subunit
MTELTWTPSQGPRSEGARGARASSQDRPSEPVLEVRGLTKRYGGVHALRGVDLAVSAAGTVHCLVGQNGSGKSTLLGILSGQTRPDAGQVLLNGAPVSFRGAPEAVGAGIVMVSQETAVAPDLSVAENVLLGRLVRRRGRVDWRASQERAAAVLQRLGLSFDPRSPVRSLRPDQRQMVEIARALSIDARVLILDEPTSFLTEDEVERLFQAVRDISADGVSTIFVSHRLPELFAIADEVTVLRDGRTVSSGPVGGYDPTSLVTAMVGSATEPPAAGTRRQLKAVGVQLLSASEISDGRLLHDVSIEVNRGEIVGVAGLAGSGRSELLEAIYGARQVEQGEIRVDGQPLRPGDPRRSIGSGVGFVPADRKTDGLVLSMSVMDNLCMAASAGKPWWRPNRRRELEPAANAAMADLRVKAASPDVLVQTLSGGNQQKVAVGKWLMQQPKVLLLEEPTRGVDVAAKAEIHGLLRRLAGNGLGLLVSSSENEELLNLCDRIVVTYRGGIVASVDPHETTEIELARLCGGTQ